MPSSKKINVILDLNLVSSLTYFKHTTVDEVNVLLSKMNKTTCSSYTIFIELFSLIY